MLSGLQHHYALRSQATYPGTYAEAVDKALLFVLKSATNAYFPYIANKADLVEGECKQNLLRQLSERLEKPIANRTDLYDNTDCVLC